MTNEQEIGPGPKALLSAVFILLLIIVIFSYESNKSYLESVGVIQDQVGEVIETCESKLPRHKRCIIKYKAVVEGAPVHKGAGSDGY